MPAKLALLRDYDPPGMDRAATICHWGRSGSVLLASYFDGHDDIITLPNQTSEYAYPFCREYQSLSLWEKLVAYPAYSQVRKGNAGDFFLKHNPDGDFAVEPVHYFASVQALFAIYGDNPAVGLHARRRFFQFLHVAYAGALDRPRVNPRPLMISAQHWINSELRRPSSKIFRTRVSCIPSATRSPRSTHGSSAILSGNSATIPILHPAIGILHSIRSGICSPGMQDTADCKREHAPFASRICIWSPNRPCGDWPNGSA